VSGEGPGIEVCAREGPGIEVCARKGPLLWVVCQGNAGDMGCQQGKGRIQGVKNMDKGRG